MPAYCTWIYTPPLLLIPSTTHGQLSAVVCGKAWPRHTEGKMRLCTGGLDDGAPFHRMAVLKRDAK